MRKHIFILLAFNTISISNAQVGIETKQSKATLDVKNTNLSNFTEGIISPQLTRAQLTAKDNEYNIEHKSTLIYVGTIDGIASEKTSLVTKPGFYLFNGYYWRYAEDKLRYFILPAFKLKIDPLSTQTTGLQLDIYNDIYRKQLTKQGTGVFISSNTNLEATLNTIYESNELDYVVIHYDTKVLKNISISANGIMTYDIKSFDLNIDSFINIVLVVK